MVYENPRLYDTYDRDLQENLEQRLLETTQPPQLSNNAISVLEKRYLKKGEDGTVQENPQQLFARVAVNITHPDLHYGASEEEAFQTAQTFYNMIANGEFTPNSPTLMNAGRELQQLAACFVLPIEDNMKSIFGGVYTTSMIHKSGGGTGFSFSRIRRKNHHVSSTYGKASGPVSFITAYDGATHSVNQGGFRRGANMGMLKVDHPDIVEFIYAKQNERDRRFENFNFSVALTDEFMEAAKKGEHYLVHNPVNGELQYLTLDDLLADQRSVEQGLLNEKEVTIKIGKDGKIIYQNPTKMDLRGKVEEIEEIEIGKLDDQNRVTYNAQKIFNIIAELAHKNGEPGIVFLDEINRHNPTPHIGDIEATNPCGEQPLLPYEACNLGSINLGLMVKDEEVNYEKLREVVHNSVHFLDNVIDMSDFSLPLPRERIKEIATTYQKLLQEEGIEKSYEELEAKVKSEVRGPIEEMVCGNRKIGLGVMGFANMLIKLGIPYNSEEGLQKAEEVMKYIQEESKKASKELADQRGVFPNFEGSIYDNGNLESRIRNATTTTIAPTGTISIIGGASSGMEPLFAVAYIHTDAEGKQRQFINEEFKEYLSKLDIDSEAILQKLNERISLQDLDVPENIKKIFITAQDMSPEEHVRIQAAFQKYTDNAVSKTINMQNRATIDDVIEAYSLAHELECKGITVYRDGSREKQVLTTGIKEESLPLGVTIKDGYVIPKERDRMVNGKTIKQRTGCGALFVTINEDDYGNPIELFANLGKAGGCPKASTESSGRLISLSLRGGVNPREIINHMAGIGCHKPVMGPEGALSCADGIAKSLTEYMAQKSPEQEEMYEQSISENNHLDTGACPDCGAKVDNAEGCIKCSKDCGYSECS